MTEKASCPTAGDLIAWADDADAHGLKMVPVSPATLRQLAAERTPLPQQRIVALAKKPFPKTTMSRAFFELVRLVEKDHNITEENHAHT